MDEIEDYSESIHEQSNEHAHHVMHESGGKEKWVVFVALTTAVFAVLAAITGLLAGDHADEAMLAQMKSSDSWSFYQAKGIKADMLAASNNVLISLGKTPDTASVNKVKREKKEQAAIMDKAKEYQKESDGHVVKHKIMARGVTMFQIAIAIGAISIITKRRLLWVVSMGFAAVGIVFLLQGLGLF
jgi:Na+-translocating ferredoxin:NAD+ oxidoreductase RnfD subunit